MRKNKPGKSVRPIYIFGLVWLLYSLLFPLSGFWSFIKCICVSGIIAGLIGSKSRKKNTDGPTEEQVANAVPKRRTSDSIKRDPQPAPTAAEESAPPPKAAAPADEVVLQGRRYVMRIQELNDDIPDYKISAQLKQIEILTDSIIDLVEEKKEKQKEIRQFMNYYLPTTIKLLEQYVQMQNVGLQGDNISAGMKKIEDMLDKVIVAFQKQLDSLFERDIVDITADIQVMEQMMKAQGLTNQSDF